MKLLLLITILGSAFTLQAEEAKVLAELRSKSNSTIVPNEEIRVKYLSDGTIQQVSDDDQMIVDTITLNEQDAKDMNTAILNLSVAKIERRTNHGLCRKLPPAMYYDLYVVFPEVADFGHIVLGDERKLVLADPDCTNPKKVNPKNPDMLMEANKVYKMLLGFSH